MSPSLYSLTTRKAHSLNPHTTQPPDRRRSGDVPPRTVRRAAVVDAELQRPPKTACVCGENGARSATPNDELRTRSVLNRLDSGELLATLTPTASSGSPPLFWCYDGHRRSPSSLSNGPRADVVAHLSFSLLTHKVGHGPVSHHGPARHGMTRPTVGTRSTETHTRHTETAQGTLVKMLGTHGFCTQSFENTISCIRKIPRKIVK
jgi:hypothetical protein